MNTQTISLIVNGRYRTLQVKAGESLLEVLRERLCLTGTKNGCNVGECGACTVLVDGLSVNSCLYLAVRADGRTVETIEGERNGDTLSAIQSAFVEEHAIQCGFCTPGFIMSTKELLRSCSDPTDEQIQKGLAGNLCRCTGYHAIFSAAKKCVGGPSPETLEE